VSDSPLWRREPVVVTGHADGTTQIWQIDVLNSTFREAVAIRVFKTPVLVVQVLAEGKALLMIDERGETYVASVDVICAKFIHLRLFEKCSSCGNSVKGGAGTLCSVCNLAVCKNCLCEKRPAKCVFCREIESGHMHRTESDSTRESRASTTEEEDGDETALQLLGTALPEFRTVSQYGLQAGMKADPKKQGLRYRREPRVAPKRTSSSGRNWRHSL
jgi:hypothetical protein